MINQKLQIGDIIEGWNCLITAYRTEQFKVVSILETFHLSYNDVSTIRLNNSKTKCNLGIHYTADNWRLIKRNGDTICEQCNVRK